MATAEATLNNPNAGYFDSGGGGTQGAQQALPSTLASNANPNARFQFSGVQSAPAPDHTMDAAAIQQNQSAPGIPMPPNAPNPASTATNSAATNASVATGTSVPNDPANPQPTAAQNQQTSFLQKIANLVGGQKSLATDQVEQEAVAGVPDMTKQINDLTTQLNGLTDQSNLLTNASDPYGAIQNAQRLAESGGNLQAAQNGRPNVKEQLLQNNIQQNSISAKSLQLKSQILVLQNNYSAAKDAADKAAGVIFDGITQQINYQKAQLDSIAPQLTRDEKAQAAAQTAALTAKANQVDQQKEEYTAGLGLISGAMKFNGQDPQAQLAIQKANAIDPTDPQYLQKVGALLAQYQADPNAAQKSLDDHQMAQANIAQSNAAVAASYANTAKTKLETQQLTDNTGGSSLAQTNLRTTTSGIDYVDGTNLTGKDATAAQHAAAKAGVPYLDKTSADLQNNVETARQNMKNISDSLDGLLATSGYNVLKRIDNAASSYTQIGPHADALASFGAYRSAAIQALRAMAGAKGLRINQAEIMQSVNQDIPKVTDTVGVAQAKIKIVNSLLDAQEKGTFGSKYYQPSSDGNSSQSPTGTTQMIGPDGKTYSVPNENVQKFKDSGGKTSFSGVGGDTKQASAIIKGFDITTYATDPTHEAKVTAITSRIGTPSTPQQVDQYIMRIAPNSPVKGQDVMDAAAATGTPPELIMALMQQDSSFGTQGKAVRTKNPGNVGNTDSGATVSHSSWRDGVFAVAKNLAKRRV